MRASRFAHLEHHPHFFTLSVLLFFDNKGLTASKITLINPAHKLPVCKQQSKSLFKSFRVAENGQTNASKVVHQASANRKIIHLESKTGLFTKERQITSHIVLHEATWHNSSSSAWTRCRWNHTNSTSTIRSAHSTINREAPLQPQADPKVQE